MSLSDGGVQATMPVAPTGMMNSGFGGFGGDGAWWIIILFLFVFCGWGGNGWGNNGNSGGVVDGYVLTSDFANVERKIDSVNQGLCDGFYQQAEVAVNGVIPLGSLIRRYGCDISLNGNAVNIIGKGYYDVDVSVTVAPTAAGTVTATLIKDGVVVPGATASANAAAGAPVALAFPALVRQACCASGSALSLVLTGAASTVSNVALRVQRI